ncbi:NAD(P)-dependent dehydrogenase (short-subunit alcohol dehydrogenase family) [Rhodoligotrophos appendicifer]|uniref:SDR family oxidoreductase n=1 Tax=Rhodoligotrophos appendicifer TaxID=987056 RepID=UPI0014796574|nr:SDR family NAD(P)-dependent oxidoreductase [Rhodoligotrophos appendicifer]
MSENPVIIVTGAGKGLGYAIARAVIDDGACAVLVVRAASRKADIEAALGERALVVVADVNDAKGADTIIGSSLTRFGRIDGLVNNAGVIEPIGKITETDETAWAQLITTNLVAPYRLTRALLREQGTGIRRIVNISSGAAHRPMEGWSAYCASKAGLAMLTRSVQLEYGDAGILAFGLVPGLVDTDMQGTIRASGVNDVSRLPKSALRPAEEPAKAAAFLLAGKADDLAGGEVEIRDPSFREKVGLPPL